MEVTELGITNVPVKTDSEKTAWLIVLNDSDILSSPVRLWQYSKALKPTEVTVLGIINEPENSLLAKAKLPIVVSESERVSVPEKWHDWKA